MNPSAQVKSLEALQDFRVAFCRFGSDALDALCSTDLEVRHAFDWLDDQLKYWQKEVHYRREEAFQAKLELQHRKSMKFLGRTPDCSEQEEAYERAVDRLETAEDKVATCRRWGPMLQQAVQEYEGPARQLGGMLEGQLPRSAALLDRAIGSLEAYLGLSPAAGPASSAPPAGTAQPTTVPQPGSANPQAAPGSPAKE